MTMSEQTEAVQVARRETSLSLKQVTDRVNLVHEVLNKVMKEGTHYGKVPGCGDKKVLLKPGADVLAMTFKLVPQFAVTRTELEHGHKEYDVTCSMYGADGSLLGQGVGSASTMEKKYRYRWEGEGTARRKIENEDIADVYNTVLKMAKKRAHVDATLTVTGAADIFTQDLIDEDGDDAAPKKPVTMPTLKTKPAAATTKGPDALQGVVEKVTTKTGTGKRGDWTKYGVMIGQEWYGTFDEKMGKTAEALQGSLASFTFTDDGKYKTLTSIAAAEASAPAEDMTPPTTREPGNPDDDDNLPFAAGDEQPKTITVADVAALESRLSPSAVAKARKTIGIAKDSSLADLDAEFLDNLAHLYRAAL
jgi:hypothetical protein